MISTTESQTQNQIYQLDHHQPINENLSMRYGKLVRLVEFDLSDLSRDTINKYRKKLCQLADNAHLSRVQITFFGLGHYIKSLEQINCCTLDTSFLLPYQREIIELMTDIQAKSSVSPRKYDIELKF